VSEARNRLLVSNVDANVGDAVPFGAVHPAIAHSSDGGGRTGRSRGPAAFAGVAIPLGSEHAGAVVAAVLKVLQIHARILKGGQTQRARRNIDRAVYGRVRRTCAAIAGIAKETPFERSGGVRTQLVVVVKAAVAVNPQHAVPRIEIGIAHNGGHDRRIQIRDCVGGGVVQEFVGGSFSCIDPAPALAAFAYQRPTAPIAGHVAEHLQRSDGPRAIGIDRVRSVGKRGVASQQFFAILRVLAAPLIAQIGRAIGPYRTPLRQSARLTTSPTIHVRFGPVFTTSCLPRR